ncbi:hypothetical protein JL722_13554 [Aureococcus anophagefferens]|nr:hypothetical protein JL722_13554 [Aureococcus anophagefferens]
MLRPADKTLVKDAATASVAAVAVAAAVGSQFSTCAHWSASLVDKCRSALSQDLPHDLSHFVAPFVEPLCGTLAEGHWALCAIVVANAACYLPAKVHLDAWAISRHTLSHERLLKSQLAHANHGHILGNMLTLLAVGSEVSAALGCNQLLLLALYLAVLRPNAAVDILGDVKAAHPLMLLFGTLMADLTRGGIWQGHFGGGGAAPRAAGRLSS